REHVRFHALADLGGELVRAGKAVAHLRLLELIGVVLERRLQRSGRGDLERGLVASAAAGKADQDEQACGEPALQLPRSTITEVAFTVAVADTPGARPSPSTASRVTAAVIRWGAASISTSAITPSTSTEVTTPGKRLRADSVSPASWRCGCGDRRSISACGTSRRLRASRVVRSLPARSQRRSVS